MKVTREMDVDALAERIGNGASRTLALEMRCWLVINGWEGKDTKDIPEREWTKMLSVARMYAATAAEYDRPGAYHGD